MTFGRRVVTGPTGIVTDGAPPRTVDVAGGPGVAELAWFATHPDVADAPFERAGDGFPLEPPPGGISARLIRLPPTGEWLTIPGPDGEPVSMHRTDTLDFVVVTAGRILLQTGDGSEVALGPGDTVVQRGAMHRWKVLGDDPCTYLAVLLRPRPDTAAPPPLSWRPGTGHRRVVTVDDALTDDGASSSWTAPTGAVGLVDLWHTGGPLVDVAQGGDPTGPWQLSPPPGGASFRLVELAPAPPDERGWHQTATVDLDLVVDGRLALDLPGGVSVELGPGDAVLQRGTDHRWRVVGDTPVRFFAVMLGLEPDRTDAGGSSR